MKHLIKFKLFEYNDHTLLKFFYQLDDISKQMDENSSDGWWTHLNYEWKEEEHSIEIDFGGSGYSDGWSENWKVDYSDIEYIWVTTEYASDKEFQNKMKFDSFNDVIVEIRSQCF